MRFICLFLLLILSSNVFAATQTVELDINVKSDFKQTIEKYKPLLIGFSISLLIIIIGFVLYLLIRKALQW